MTTGGLNRRGLLLLCGVALISGCKVIPRGPPASVPPPVAENDALPTDAARHRVALLVPLSGPNAALGQSLENATQMALLDTNAQNLRITTYDTGLGAAAAAASAARDGNRLIVGPLLADDVAVVARAVRIPVISFAADPGVAARDVFVMGTSVEQSVGRSIDFARGRGLHRFGALLPAGDYGARAGAALAASVRARGGALVGVETYERSNPSIVSAAHRLKSRGALDAVLVADAPRYAMLAAPQLKAGSPALRIIGTELWTGESAVAKAPALRGAWFAAIADARFRQFAGSYQSRFGKQPYRNSTLGYDAVLLTIRIARDWKPGSPFPVNRLLDIGGFLGLDGAFRFIPDGTSERALEVREVHAGGITVASPAPARFADGR